MKLPFAFSLVSLLALTGCDDRANGPSDDDNTFRAEGGSDLGKIIREVERPVKKKGCDAIWWLMDEGELVSYEEAQEEWLGKIRVGAEHTADAVLQAYGAGGMCSTLCTEAGGKWTGDVSLEESWHEVGETEVVGECPFGTLATETEVLAMGAVGCTCSL